MASVAVRGAPFVAVGLESGHQILLKLHLAQRGETIELESLAIFLDSGLVYREKLSGSSIGRRLKASHDTQSIERHEYPSDQQVGAVMVQMIQALQAGTDISASCELLPPNQQLLKLAWGSRKFGFELTPVSNSWSIILEQVIAPIVGVSAALEGAAATKGVSLTVLGGGILTHAKAARGRTPSETVAKFINRPSESSACQRWTQRHDGEWKESYATVSETWPTIQIADKTTLAPSSSSSSKPQPSAVGFFDNKRVGEKISFESDSQVDPEQPGPSSGRRLASSKAAPTSSKPASKPAPASERAGARPRFSSVAYAQDSKPTKILPASTLEAPVEVLSDSATEDEDDAPPSKPTPKLKANVSASSNVTSTQIVSQPPSAQPAPRFGSENPPPPGQREHVVVGAAAVAKAAPVLKPSPPSRSTIPSRRARSPSEEREVDPTLAALVDVRRQDSRPAPEIIISRSPPQARTSLATPVKKKAKRGF